MNLFEEFKSWLETYIPDKNEARGLAALMSHKAYKQCRIAFSTGLIIGAIGAVIFIAWLS